MNDTVERKLFLATLANEIAVEALVDLLADAHRVIEQEHGQKPWHETCPTCEVYERIDRIVKARRRD